MKNTLTKDTFNKHKKLKSLFFTLIIGSFLNDSTLGAGAEISYSIKAVDSNRSNILDNLSITYDKKNTESEKDEVEINLKNYKTKTLGTYKEGDFLSALNYVFKFIKENENKKEGSLLITQGAGGRNNVEFSNKLKYVANFYEKYLATFQKINVKKNQISPANYAILKENLNKLLTISHSNLIRSPKEQTLENFEYTKELNQLNKELTEKLSNLMEVKEKINNGSRKTTEEQKKENLLKATEMPEIFLKMNKNLYKRVKESMKKELENYKKGNGLNFSFFKSSPEPLKYDPKKITEIISRLFRDHTQNLNSNDHKYFAANVVKYLERSFQKTFSIDEYFNFLDNVTKSFEIIKTHGLSSLYSTAKDAAILNQHVQGSKDIAQNVVANSRIHLAPAAPAPAPVSGPVSQEPTIKKHSSEIIEPKKEEGNIPKKKSTEAIKKEMEALQKEIENDNHLLKQSAEKHEKEEKNIEDKITEIKNEIKKIKREENNSPSKEAEEEKNRPRIQNLNKEIEEKEAQIKILEENYEKEESKKMESIKRKEETLKSLTFLEKEENSTEHEKKTSHSTIS